MILRRGVVVAMVAVLVASLLPGTQASAVAEDPTVLGCADEAASEAQAAEIASRCNRRVAVSSSRTELTQVVAAPDGRLTFESAVVPQRTRRADGSWVDIDLNLTRGADGRPQPTASVADVDFSGGGHGPLVTLAREGKTFTLSWPGRLPAPVLSEESATYTEVLPGVDLVVRATHTGFTHVLAVKTPEAAANPALRKIRFAVGGDAKVHRLADGSLRATAGDLVLASAPPAIMWDSSTTGDGAAQGLSTSSAVAPGDAARTVSVATEVSPEGDLLLTPDAALLSAHPPAFPVFVDPAWSTGKSKWAYATNNGSTNTDYTVARVGKNPETGALYRSYFEFPTTANGITLKGKHIESAYVQMKLDHSWSCSDTWTHMYLTPVINSTMKASWSTMKLSKWLDSAEGHANEAGGCGVIQPDMIMNFTGSTVTGQVQTAATSNWNTITVGFCACNPEGEYETSQDRWKKFFPNDAKLIVDYDSRPGKPTGLQVAGVACPTSGVLTIGTLSPTFSAVYPDADSGQTLTGAYEWIEVPSGGISTVTDSYPTRLTPPARPSAPANGRGTTSPVTAVKGKTYAYRVTTVDPAPYSQWSGWSIWCQFAVDTAVPPVTVTIVSAPAGPGMPGTFRIESTATDVVKFRYGWNSASTEVAAQGTSPKYVQLTLTAPKYGLNTLHVAAIDATANIGNGSRDFTVARPSPPVARWGLEAYPGVTQTQALADQQPALAGDTPMTATDVSWADDVRLIGGQTARFNGTSSMMRASAPIVDTAGSFSVAAWAKVDSFSGCVNLTVASMDDIDAAFSPFMLGYSCWTGKWWFRVSDREVGEPEYTNAMSANDAAIGRWTHIAGVWDEPEQKVKLYIDGVLSASVTPSSSWLATRGAGWTAGGPFQISRDRGYGYYGGNFRGEIADVQLFNRALVDQDLTGELAPEGTSGVVDEPGILTPIEVGRWNFNGAVPCYEDPSVAGTCEAPDGGAWSRRLALSQGTWIGSGNRDLGLELNGTHWIDDPYDPYYGMATQEYGWSQKNLGDPANPVWQDAPVLRTDQSFTVSVWAYLTDNTRNYSVVSQAGSHESGFWIKHDPLDGKWKFIVTDDDITSAAQSGVASTAPAEVGVWTHLAGVYDAGRNELRLYVNGTREASKTLGWTPMASPGPLYVGRTLWHDTACDFWNGGIDDVYAFQGAMTDAQVRVLYDAQVVVEP